MYAYYKLILYICNKLFYQVQYLNTYNREDKCMN